MGIFYFSEEINFKLNQKKKVSAWLQMVIQQEGYRLEQLNFIFCSDHYLLMYNKGYLGHNTLTDVITFDYATCNKTILGDIYISIERVNENAKHYQCKTHKELYTVMVHGLLHLLAYGDQTTVEIAIIRQKESFYLNQLLPNLSQTTPSDTD